MLNRLCFQSQKKPTGFLLSCLLLLFAIGAPLASACDAHEGGSTSEPAQVVGVKVVGVQEDPVAQCAAKVATIGEAVPCLKSTLAEDEATLNKLAQTAKQEAQRVDAGWPQVKATSSLAVSTHRWQQYRDAECQRREAFRAGGNHPDIGHYSCMIEKTRERIRDFQGQD